MNIQKSTTVIVAFAAIFSLTIGFIPQTYAGTVLTVDIQPFCGFSTQTGTIDQTTTPPNDAVFTMNLINSGTATLPISASLGDATVTITTTNVGGFADGTRQGLGDIAILPQDVAVDAANTGTDTIASQQFNEDGTSVVIANLAPTGAEGEGAPRGVTITAITTNIQNLPKVGVQSADLFLTGGTCV